MVLLSTKHHGEVLINIDLCEFTTEYETLFLIKEIKYQYFTTTSLEGEKGLPFHSKWYGHVFGNNFFPGCNVYSASVRHFKLSTKI